jgi:hypothetical protein
MTTKKLAEVGIPSSSENVPLTAENPIIEAVRESASHEEDISNVDVNRNELVGPKSSYPPTFVFGKSLVTPELIKLHANDSGPPNDEEVHVVEIVVFRDFFTTGLRFPCDIHSGSSRNGVTKTDFSNTKLLLQIKCHKGGGML